MDRPKTFRETLAVWRANLAMVEMIAGRRHVGESFETVQEYVVSKLRDDAPNWQRVMVARLTRMVHRRNRKLYEFVMGGGHGYTGRN